MRLETVTRTDDPGQFRMPLPPTLEAVLAERGVEQLAHHRQLASRYKQATEDVKRAQLALERAGAADREAEAAFAADPAAKLPPSRADRARERFEQAERERDVLGLQLKRSASELTAAAEPYVDAAVERAVERIEADAAEAREALEAALELLGRRGPTTREAAWLSTAQTKNRVHAWRPTGGVPDAAQQHVRQALVAHDEEVRKRQEQREQRRLAEEVIRLQESGLSLGEARDQALKSLAGAAA